jgi:hypothetical protein
MFTGIALADFHAGIASWGADYGKTSIEYARTAADSENCSLPKVLSLPWHIDDMTGLSKAKRNQNREGNDSKR